MFFPEELLHELLRRILTNIIYKIEDRCQENVDTDYEEANAFYTCLSMMFGLELRGGLSLVGAALLFFYSNRFRNHSHCLRAPIMIIKPNPMIHTRCNGYWTKYTTGVRSHSAGFLRKLCPLMKSAIDGE